MAVADDVVVAAPDEVPPHHQLVGEGDAAQQHHARRPIRKIAQVQCTTAGALVPEVGGGQRRTAYFHGARVAQDTVFKCGVYVDVQARVRVEIDLGAEQWSKGVHRRTAAGQLAEKYPGHRTRKRRACGRIVGEVAPDVAVGVR